MDIRSMVLTFNMLIISKRLTGFTAGMISNYFVVVFFCMHADIETAELTISLSLCLSPLHHPPFCFGPG